MLHRRQLLTGLIAAPLVAAAGSLMPLRGVVISAADLVIYPFTLSWWEHLNDTARWRQRVRRFTAYGAPPSVEINPAMDTDCVAGVQLDAGSIWVSGHRLSVAGVTWREGPRLISRPYGAEIELTSEEERALIAHGDDTRARFGVII